MRSSASPVRLSASMTSQFARMRLHEPSRSLETRCALLSSSASCCCSGAYIALEGEGRRMLMLNGLSTSGQQWLC